MMKLEDIRKGSVIRDEYGAKYLVVNIKEDKNVIEALDQKFDIISLGIYPWIKNYDLVENISIGRIVEFLF